MNAMATHGLEQYALDRASEGETDDRRRHERHRKMQPEALRCALGRDANQRMRKSMAVLPDDGQHGAGLDDDVEHLAALIVEAEQIGRQDQVPGARDRQKLGQPLDDAEDQCMQE